MEYSKRNVGKLPDGEMLRQLYCIDGKTVREIAQHYRCRTSTLLRAMDEAGIARRRRGRSRAALPDWDTQKLHQLVKAKGMPYVRGFARHHGINRVKLAALFGERPLARGQHRRHVLVDHDDAIRCDYDEGVSIKALTVQYGCSRRAIGYSLDRTSRKQ